MRLATWLARSMRKASPRRDLTPFARAAAASPQWHVQLRCIATFRLVRLEAMEQKPVARGRDPTQPRRVVSCQVAADLAIPSHVACSSFGPVRDPNTPRWRIGHLIFIVAGDVSIIIL